MSKALEAEVAAALGRDYYQNGAHPGAGYRNGHRCGRLATAEGVIEYGIPQVADRLEPFVCSVHRSLAGRTAELGRLAVEMLARRPSTRDIESALRDAAGRSGPAEAREAERGGQERATLRPRASDPMYGRRHAAAVGLAVGGSLGATSQSRDPNLGAQRQRYVPGALRDDRRDRPGQHLWADIQRAARHEHGSTASGARIAGAVYKAPFHDATEAGSRQRH